MQCMADPVGARLRELEHPPGLNNGYLTADRRFTQKGHGFSNYLGTPLPCFLAKFKIVNVESRHTTYPWPLLSLVEWERFLEN